MFDQVEFGEKLKNHRKSLRLTQEEVANKLGVTSQAVSKWELGECLPDGYNLKQLSEVYGISLDILLEVDNNLSLIDKIKQLANEIIWKNLKEEKEKVHKELGEDLWEIWKAVYFSEIGNEEQKSREIKIGKNRVIGPYGIKVWDDNGIACVVKSDIKNHLEKISSKQIKILNTLLTEDYISVLKELDSFYPISKDKLIENTKLDESKLNEIIIYLTENNIITYYSRNNHNGYKLTSKNGAVSYLVLALAYLLIDHPYSRSEFLPNE